MNKWNGIGRLTKAPDVRYTANTQMAVAKFNVAIDDGYGEKKKTNFIPVTAFGKTAEAIEKYTDKGLRIAIEGRITTGSYDNKEGKKVFTMEVTADRVEFLDWKDSQRTGHEQITAEVPDGFAELDCEVPF